MDKRALICYNIRVQINFCCPRKGQKGNNMKNENHANPYRSLGFDKIDAPNKKKNDAPKASKNTGNDLRVGGNKK